MKKSIRLFAVACGFLSAAATAAEDGLTRAHEATENYCYGEAYVHFLDAAKQGNVQAQRTVGLMALYGENLYGPEVRQNISEAIKWLSLAASAGDDMSNQMLSRFTYIGARTSLAKAPR